MRSGYNGNYNRLMQPIRQSGGAKQTWEIGAIVNVGFLKGLTVREMHANGTCTLESSKGAWYHFEPHGGIYRMDSPLGTALSSGR